MHIYLLKVRYMISYKETSLPIQSTKESAQELDLLGLYMFQKQMAKFYP